MLISVDIGYGFTKTEPGGVVFPSLVCQGREVNLKYDNYDETNELYYNGKKYFIGELALREGITSPSYEKE